jgi:hypothetical protein
MENQISELFIFIENSVYMPSRRQFVPLILDMVEDKVRNRFVTVLFVLMSYILMVFTIVMVMRNPDPDIT